MTVPGAGGDFSDTLAGKALSAYGDGQQIRDWLYAKDYRSAIRRVREAGAEDDVYNAGGWKPLETFETGIRKTV